MAGIDAPFLHKPDMIDDHPRNGLICFLNMDRPCGPDCMCFCVQPEGKDYFNQQWAMCRLLVDVFRASKHIAILTASLGETARAMKKEVQDRQRKQQAPVVTMPTAPPVPVTGDKA